jgi:hypothetical protein
MKRLTVPAWFYVRIVQLSLAEWVYMICTPHRLLLCLCVLYGFFGAAPAWADTVVAAKRIELPGLSLQDVQAQLSPGASPNTLQVSLHAGKADVPALGWRHVGLTLTGNLRRDLQMRWMFDGAVQLAGAPGGALGNATVNLVIDAGANTLSINADQGAAHIGMAFPLDQTSHAQVNLHNLPIGWLQGVMATIWPGRITGGKLDADLALDVRDQSYQSSGDFTVADLKYVTPGGNPGGEGLNGRARFALDTTLHPAQIQLNGTLHGGELQFGPVLARLPTHDVVLDLAANVEKGGLAISRLHLDDADALQLDGALSIDAKGNLQKLKLDHFQARFPAAYQRYGQSWFDSELTPGLQIVGQVDGHVDVIGDTWRSFALHTEGLDLADSTGQLQANGLHGALDWSEQDDRPATLFGWNQLVVRQYAIGALQVPLDIPILKGQVHLAALEWQPTAAKSDRINLMASISGVDMALLNQSIGWTPFAGTLGGNISSMQWVDGRYALQGEMTIKAFDGSAVIKHLSLQQPFDNAPILTGDVSVHQLDLAPLADTFNFGSMTGRLDGSINGLQLTGGNPVAFKASLLAQDGGRISLRAANNLSIVTGGTAASGLQGAVMKLFKMLSYKRMGIQADLQNGVCLFSGLDGDAPGYTIVEGTGLPYLHVVGEQTKVEWPVFLHRLKVASQGAVAER